MNGLLLCVAKNSKVVSQNALNYSSKTLSVIMPNYNDAKHIAISLQAICEQSFLPIEVIVIDNCSTDDSIHVLKEMMTKYPFIRLVQNDMNYGHSYSVNKAAQLARGDYLYVSSANDLIYSGFFEKSMNMLITYPEAGLCFTDFEIINTTNGNSVVNQWRPQGGHYFPQQLADMARTTQTTFAAGPDTILRRNILPTDRIYMAEIYVYSDWFLSKLIAFRFGCCYIPEPLVAVRQIDNSLADKVFKNRANFQQQSTKVIQLYASPAYEDIVPPILRSRSLRNIIPTMRTPLTVFKTIYSMPQRNRYGDTIFLNLIGEYVADICAPIFSIMQRCQPTIQFIHDIAVSGFYFIKNLWDRTYAQAFHKYKKIKLLSKDGNK